MNLGKDRRIIFALDEDDIQYMIDDLVEDGGCKIEITDALIRHCEKRVCNDYVCEVVNEALRVALEDWVAENKS